MIPALLLATIFQSIQVGQVPPALHYGEVVASPAPTSTPTAAPTSSTASASTYTARRCGDLILATHLLGKPITADNLGKILAQALRNHGFRPGAPYNSEVIGRSVVDFVGCFQTKGHP